MKIKQYKDLLETPLFSGIDYKQYKEATRCLQPKIHTFIKGETILNPGEYAFKIAVILSGTASCYYEIASGERMQLFSAKPGDLVGALCAISKENFDITVSAGTNSTVAFISSLCFINLFDCKPRCTAHNKLVYNMLHIIAETSLYLYSRTIMLTMRTIRSKICFYLLSQYNILNSTMLVLPMNRNELAVYLNITRPSLSRELCLLQRENVIEYCKNAFQILDLKRLKQFAIGLTDKPAK